MLLLDVMHTLLDRSSPLFINHAIYTFISKNSSTVLTYFRYNIVVDTLLEALPLWQFYHRLSTL